MPLEKAHALVLRTSAFRETSCVVTLWTREFGKVRALAKGGRRLRSRFQSALDVLHLCDIVLIRKTSAQLDLLTEAHLVDRFNVLRQSLQAYYAACFILEILCACAQENDPHPQWFDTTIRTLRQLQPPHLLRTLLSWEIIALRELGMHPMLDQCVQCKKLLEVSSSSQPITWNALAGGVLCARCAMARSGQRTLQPELWHAWRCIAKQQDFEFPEATCQHLIDLLHDYWSHRLEQPLRLASYLSTAS
ncbi:MAG: DNA repair protein RecO [Gemmatales bacterium]|nr:DNA repair protein RecO [Gemmatales bacterium]MDW7994755.1 DNA repair protein RecO [Gemmatales bacterium]